MLVLFMDTESRVYVPESDHSMLAKLKMLDQDMKAYPTECGSYVVMKWADLLGTPSVEKTEYTCEGDLFDLEFCNSRCWECASGKRRF